MFKNTGYIIFFDEAQRTELLEERGINSGSFADALSAPDWGLKEWEICLISFGSETIDYACLAQRGNRVATAKYRVDFTNLVDLEQIPLKTLHDMMPVNLKNHFIKSSTGRGSRVPKETWIRLIDAVKSCRPNAVEDIERLFRLRYATLDKFTGHAADIVALEKDAVGVALDIFAPSTELRKRTLHSWAPTDDKLAPFLHGIDSVKLTEEQMLAHDSMVFPKAISQPTMLGSRFQINHRLLDVI